MFSSVRSLQDLLPAQTTAITTSIPLREERERDMQGHEDDNNITWYAFQCPKTGREFFYEPSNGTTTWALPTSKSIANSQPKTLLTNNIGQRVSTTCQTSRKVEEKNMGNKTNSPSQWAVVVVMTLAVTVICNTVFLVVLVKISSHHPRLPHLNANSILQAVSNQNLLQHVNGTRPIELLSLDSDVDCTVDASAEEEKYNEITSSVPFSYPAPSGKNREEGELDVPEETHTPPKMVKQNEFIQHEKNMPPLSTMEEIARSVVHPAQETTLSNTDGDGQKMSTTSKTTTPQTVTQTKKDSDMKKISRDTKNNKGSSVVPVRCWVPFAHVFHKKCKVIKDTGKHSPSFDVEQFVMAMI